MSAKEEINTKSHPAYDGIKKTNELLQKLIDSQEQTNNLLTSLNRYHGNPESSNGWLELNYELNLCRKKNENKRYSTSFKITMYTLTLATGLAIAEFFSGVPVFSTFWEYGKGMFL